jgi:hypothetical protein
MKLVITTISQGQVAIVESEQKADEKKGERYISEDCLKANLNKGTFVDISERGINPEGRLFIFHEDLA